MSSTTRPDRLLRVKRLDPALPLPAYQHDADAGLDLHAAEAVTLAPGHRAVVATGIAVAIPVGCCGLVAPRSGRAAAEGLSVVNAPGVVDSGYRGEVKVVLVNLDPGRTIQIRRGDRIAQLLVVPVVRPEVVEADELPESGRGDSGFGSTGS